MGPLWGFFNFIRNRSAVPLSIDQYFYFFEALHQADFKRLESKKDLLNFTKIFWLNDPSFSAQYEDHFNHFVDWKFEYNKDIKKEISDEPLIKIPPVDPKPVEEDKTPPDTTQGPSETPRPQPASEDAIVDFELVLQDAPQGAEPEEPANTYTKHDFNLTDQAIVPFDIRNFVQRLRRKVETPELVPSERLDIQSMIISYTQKGFVDDIIHEMEDASHSNVVLLADRFGSMLAYEFLEDHFRSGLNQIPYCAFEHYFFYNLPSEAEDGFHYKLTSGKAGNKVLETQNHRWNSDTWFIILSDAGAHSGMVNRERIKSSLKLWRYLRSISNHTHWINPVPYEYLNDCTAKRLQMMIPMTDPTEKRLYQMMNTPSISSK